MPRGQKDAAFYDSAALLVLSLLEEADKTGFHRLTRQGVKTLTCCREQWKTCRKPIGGGACVTK